jgi:putative N6-adenine-specific DNA methylase
MQKSRILITCAKGIPPFLKQELQTLHFPILSDAVAGVVTEGRLDDTLLLNLVIRTGHRVLFQVKEFEAKNADELYHALCDLNWEDYIPEDGYLCVTSSVENKTIKDSRYASLKCKDAIVDRIKEKRGRRPDSGALRDRSVVHLYWKDDQCSVYLDTSGDACRRSRVGNGMEWQREFHQPHVRQRDARHRGGAHRPAPDPRAFAQQLRVHAYKGIQ